MYLISRTYYLSRSIHFQYINLPQIEGSIEYHYNIIIKFSAIIYRSEGMLWTKHFSSCSFINRWIIEKVKLTLMSFCCFILIDWLDCWCVNIQWQICRACLGRVHAFLRSSQRDHLGWRSVKFWLLQKNKILLFCNWLATDSSKNCWKYSIKELLRVFFKSI